MGLKLGWLKAPAVAALFAGGYVAAHALVAPWPALAPVEALDWLPYCALAAFLIGIIVQAFRTNVPVRNVIVLVFILVGIWFFFRLTPEETRPKAPAILVRALIGFCFWLILQVLAVRLPSRAFWPIAPICAAGVAGALLLSGSISQGQAGLAFAGVALVVALIELVRPNETPNFAAVVVLVFMILAEILGGLSFSELRLAVAGLLLAAPLLAFVAAFGPMARSATLKRMVIVVLLVGIAEAAAVGLAYSLSPPIEF
jgi:hypothetical protein